MAVLGRNRACVIGGVRYERFPPPRLCKRHQAHAVQQPPGSFERRLERQHPAEAAHLTPRQRMRNCRRPG
jgi:hypothetical protein